MNRTRAIAIGLAAVVALTLTACARPGAATDATAGSPVADPGLAVLPPSHGCPQPDHATPLPADAVLVSVERCRSEIRDVPGDGRWEFRVDERATANLAPLAAALRRPSEPVSAHMVCDLVLHAQPVLTVTDQVGRQFNPTVPQTACRAPLPAIGQALDALVWVPMSATKLQQVATELEVTSGCPAGYKQMIAFNAVNGWSHAPQVAPVAIAADTLRVCRYDLDTSPEAGMPDNHGGVIHGGRLVAASTLDSKATRALQAALNAAPLVTGACAHDESPFAVVSPRDGGPFIMIELSGCYRAWVDSDNYLRQLDAATVHRLLPA